MIDVVKKYELQKIECNSDFEPVKIVNSQSAYDFIKQFYKSDIGIYESFFILMLDRKNTTIGFAKISQGGISGTHVDSKIIAKYAVDSLCNGIILAHNHPSGGTNPSNNDIELTKKIEIMLSYHDIKLFDHIILTENSFYSFNDNHLINHDQSNS